MMCLFYWKPLWKNFKKQPPEMFFKKTVFNNFAIFIGKDLCWSLFLIKLQVIRTLKLQFFKNPTQVFSCEYCEIFKNTNFEEHLQTVASEFYSNEFASAVIHRKCNSLLPYPAGIYLLKVNNRNTRTRFEICSKLTMKTMASFWCLYC